MNLLSNIKYTSLSQFVKITSQLLGVVVFAKYLSAADFGVVAMATVVINFINIIRDIGTSAAIIQRDSVSDELKSSLVWVNLFLGLFLFIVISLFSGVIASFFHSEVLSTILPLISLSLPVSSLASVHQALLEKESKFNQISKNEILSSVISFLLASFLAIHGYGVLSLVVQILSYSLFSSFGFIILSKFKPLFVISYVELKEVMRFSLNLMAFNFINYFSRNLDQIIIGRFFSVDILGAYSLAYRIMLFPVQNITTVLSRSLFPIMSRIRHDAKDSSKEYLKILSIILLTVPPLMTVIACSSTEIIQVLFGDKWHLVPLILIWLAPTAMVQSLISTTGAIFIAFGKPHYLLRISIFNCIVQVTAFIIGAQYNILMLVKLYFFANVIMFFPNIFFALKMTSVRFLDFLKALLSAFIVVLLLWFSSMLYGKLVVLDDQNITFSFIAGKLIIMSFSYVVSAALFCRILIKNIKS